MIAVVVTCCSGCPFSDDHGEEGEPWLCDAIGATDGETEPRVIPSTDERWTGTPEWCPLREDDRIVTLRSSK